MLCDDLEAEWGEVQEGGDIHYIYIYREREREREL